MNFRHGLQCQKITFALRQSRSPDGWDLSHPRKADLWLAQKSYVRAREITRVRGLLFWRNNKKLKTKISALINYLSESSHIVNGFVCLFPFRYTCTIFTFSSTSSSKSLHIVACFLCGIDAYKKAGACEYLFEPSCNTKWYKVKIYWEIIVKSA